VRISPGGAVRTYVTALGRRSRPEERLDLAMCIAISLAVEDALERDELGGYYFDEKHGTLEPVSDAMHFAQAVLSVKR
jgi:hypothetical protein